MSFLSKLLGGISGSGGLQISEQLLFDKVIGFRNIVPGCGASTIVQNVAIALSERTSYNICVLDVNFLYPMQYALLVDGKEESKGKDLLDFTDSVSDVNYMSKYNSIYVIGLNNRSIIDMMSSKDTPEIMEKVIGALKTYFDVVLVDLSGEPSNIAVHAGILCNKIYNVADTSMACIYHLKKSLNTMATLAVPLIKANKVILNKQLSDIVVDIKGALELAGLKLVGEIPFSEEIAKVGVSGGRLYGTMSNNSALSKFSSVIDSVVDDLLEKTPLNLKYMKSDSDDKSDIASKEVTSKDIIEDDEDTVEIISDTNPDMSDIADDIEISK